MHKFFFIFLLLVLTAGIALPVLAARENPSLNELLPKGIVQGKLPTAEFEKGIVPQAIKMLLAFVGTISFGVFVYAGVMLIQAQGNEEEIAKFKKILIWSLVGLVFITTAYAIVRGVMQLIFK